ncbi:MAG: SGNH/GDSL hydrolase family protein [Bacteroidaceae bacterium]|nr:SGNH/GDSL hydrolase family protein [Bacteroidaceae bacterium]
MKYIKGLIIIIILFFTCDFAVERFMKHGIDEMYGLNQYADVLLIGHSHLMLATDKQQMENDLGMKVSKYTREGVNVSDRKIMIQQILDSGYGDSLKIVLYGVDLCTFTGEGLSANSYKLFYPFIDDKNIGNYIRQQGGAKDYWLHKLVRTSRYSDDGFKNGAFRGWLHNWSNLKSGTVDIEAYKRRLQNGDERHIQMNPELIAEFKESIGMLTERGITVALVNTPTLDLLNNFEADKYDMIVEWFQTYADERLLVEYWDFNPEYSSQHELFYDRLHLNSIGQKVISKEITQSLKNLYD